MPEETEPVQAPSQKDITAEEGLPEPQPPTVIPEPSQQLPPGSAIPQ